MHKNFTHAILGLLALGLLTTTQAFAADEGIDYEIIATPQTTTLAPGQVEVIGLFWYGCPHCYHLESNLQKWLANKPAYVEFRRMPAVLGSSWAFGAKVFYAAEMLGVLDKVHEPLFKAIHEAHMQLNDANSMADWFVKQGVAREDFLGALDSFVVDMKIRQAKQLVQAIELHGVPAFLVNGKYKTSPSMTASIEKTFQVIDEIIAEEIKAK